jgi:phenylacetate-coenzyme A ligase PaaK-like adenylate-forming protein
MTQDFRNRIFNISSESDFNTIALDVFRYQVGQNPLYNEYVDALGIIPSTVNSIEKIPFLPVAFFKDYKVTCGARSHDAVFESSGTTGMSTSKHYVADIKLYEESFTKGFRYFFGDPSEYFFASVLPSYYERGNSSLVYMMNGLNQMSRYRESGFFNNNQEKLIEILNYNSKNKIKTILVGVSFALLDLAERFKPDLSGTIIVETGGMKGRRKEITRQELHNILKSNFNADCIYSEYGMTELLSQAWSKGNGLFYCPPWMKILIRDSYDPLSVFNEAGRSGGINIIDLANVNSCSFLLVSDLGKLHEDRGFEVLGRFDNSDIRGCNLLVE